MNAAGERRQQLDAASVLNAKRTLVQLLGRAGVYAGDAEELVGLVEAGALSLAGDEVADLVRSAPTEKGPLYGSGWLDGARAAADHLSELAERALRDAVARDSSAASQDARTPVGRMEVERAKVAVVPLYLSFTTPSDLDPEVSDQVLTAVLGTMGSRQRAGYAGLLAEFAAEHRQRLERLFGTYGPGSSVAVHGRYSLIHSPTSVAVLERLGAAPSALREEWDAAELPPAWLEGLATAWGSPV
ncbi:MULTISPECIES: hypothetical protein [Streptomyces]|uniref:Uncharacterized protein n=2 Tax=Streptomyces TaxID=1883 RepID=A0A100Y9T7_9ACTN|nr:MULTISPECIES: hypothetical protein [Streptomyces]KUH40291.1 hypothetical protein ATE80_03090 [Streptomyces kanasensis]UUS34286.1 hypothetical protein NRO40_27950 [Streptomyces changanensis]